jgi:hypothetical protein
MKSKFHVSIGCYYDFDEPSFRAEYDEWRGDHPDTVEMRNGFMWDRFAPENIMSMVDPNSRKEISYE